MSLNFQNTQQIQPNIGKVQGHSGKVKCPDCNGTGFVDSEKCKQCIGSGYKSFNGIRETSECIGWSIQFRK